jgi:hypothetical protein
MVDIEEYWRNNNTNFPDYEGWTPLIKEMLQVLFENGLSPNISIKAKEKYGLFVFYLYSTLNTPQLISIVNEYTERIDNSCQVCGKQAKQIEVGWIFTLCIEHYIEKSDKIQNITPNGFKYNGYDISWNNISAVKLYSNFENEMTVTSDELFSIKLYFYDRPQIPQIIESSTDNYLLLFPETINFLTFLKQLPDKLATDFLSNYIKTFCSKLYECPVCGYIAFDGNYCNYCTSCTSTLEHFRYVYGDQEAIKKLQFYWESKAYLQELKKLETSFDKA